MLSEVVLGMPEARHLVDSLTPSTCHGSVAGTVPGGGLREVHSEVDLRGRDADAAGWEVSTPCVHRQDLLHFTLCYGAADLERAVRAARTAIGRATFRVRVQAWMTDPGGGSLSRVEAQCPPESLNSLSWHELLGELESMISPDDHLDGTTRDGRAVIICGAPDQGTLTLNVKPSRPFGADASDGCALLGTAHEIATSVWPHLHREPPPIGPDENVPWLAPSLFELGRVPAPPGGAGTAPAGTRRA